VHWAHRVADRFPDGHLHGNLCGFDPVGPAVDPADAIRRFLFALDVPAHRIPADPDAAAALYRSELAGRRMLIVLDNARDEAQARPLLPGSSGCVTVVTSRATLTGLVAVEGAEPLDLDLLSTDEAAQLLGRRLGSDRLVDEWEAVTAIIERCARLPLALAIAAARAATRPHAPLAALAGELGLARNRLDTLAGADPRIDLRAVFAHSYEALSEDGQRMFRLLGLHPGADIAAPAAASLAALPLPETASLLAELTGASLLTEHTPGRYTYHDLLREYAAELAGRTDLDDALLRVLDHYLHTAHAADRRLYPGRDPLALDPPRPGSVPGSFSDERQAIDWFAAEHPNVLAAVSRAAAARLDRLTWQIAWTLRTYLGRRGHWTELTAVIGIALAAAVRLGDPEMRARSHQQLGSALIRLGRFDDSERELTRGLDEYRTIGDLVGRARTHHHLSYLFEQREQPERSLDHARQALEMYRTAGHRNGEAQALNGVGWYSTQLGDHHHALAACREALEIFEDLADGPGQAVTWDSIGLAHFGLGDHAAAITDYQRALALFRDQGNRYNEADTLTHLGDTLQDTGDQPTAQTAWRQALTILIELRHPDSQQLQARLEGHTTTW